MFLLLSGARQRSALAGVHYGWRFCVGSSKSRLRLRGSTVFRRGLSPREMRGAVSLGAMRSV